MSMLSRNILISMCAASIITALVINGIIRYKEPTHNTDEIENAHIAFKNATYDYIAARNHAAQISEDTLKKDKKYLAEKKKLDKLTRKLFHGERMMSKQEFLSRCQTLDKMTARVDSIGDELCNANMNKNPVLIYATENLNQALTRLEKVQRDSMIVDSLRNLPMHQRFNRGWENLRHDYHSALMNYHRRQLQQLKQNEK